MTVSEEPRYKVANLDKRFCDMFEESHEEETVREFIIGSEKVLKLGYADLCSMTDDELTEYVNHLEYLWAKQSNLYRYC